MIARPLSVQEAPLLHDLYRMTPNYFEMLGTRLPKPEDVQADVMTAQLDKRRRLELLFDAQNQLVGSLDYKMDYPQAGDVTINLLLIRQSLQGQHLGEAAIRDLERRLPVGTSRLLASVIGNNPRGVRFWQRLGFKFDRAAYPSMTWYSKELKHPKISAPLLPSYAPLLRSLS